MEWLSGARTIVIIKWHQRLVLQAGDFVLYQQLDASTPRSGDGRSTDARGLRLFPLPGPDAVFPIPQDALLWTYWVSPESDRGRGLWPVRAPQLESWR